MSYKKEKEWAEEVAELYGEKYWEKI